MQTTTVTRRQALLGAAAIVAAGTIAAPRLARAASPAELPPLPYAENALEPVISANTIGFHYGKHHKGYVDTLAKLIEGTDFLNQTLEEIVRTTQINPNRTAIYNAAAQSWNHTFYWNSMRPDGGGEPTGALAQRIAADFTDYEGFRKAFTAAALGQFGSGWAWLIEDKEKKLRVVRTPNADTPMAQGMKCLLTIDVWEHAYYLDYQNRRADYANSWLDKLANWDFAGKNLAA